MYLKQNDHTIYTHINIRSLEKEYTLQCFTLDVKGVAGLANQS